MNNQTNIERLIQAATTYGYTEEQIQLICDEIVNAAYEQFSQEAERLLGPDEKHDHENTQDVAAITERLQRLYLEKSGKDAQEVISGYISRHIDEFIEEHTSSTDLTPAATSQSA